MFSLYTSIQYMCSLGPAHFWPQWHNLSKLGRGPLGDAKDLGLVASDKKIFSCFLYVSLCKPATPGAGLFLAPGE